MLSPKTQKKIRQLEIVTKGLMAGPLIGDDVSAHRGYGVEFHQIREYQFGDDFRFIDWKSSSRLCKMLVKECLEERNRRVILAVDISGSSFYGSVQTRFEKIKEITTILAFAAHYAKDSVGLLLFSDEVEFIIEPKNLSSHVHFLLQKLHECQITPHKKTNLSELLSYIAKKWYKDAIVFVISDFIDDYFDDALPAAATRVDLVAVRCYDPIERVIPAAGYLMLEDVESGESLYVKTEGTKGDLAQLLHYRLKKQDKLFAQTGIDVVDISYHCDACARLIEFFKRRMIHASVRYG